MVASEISYLAVGRGSRGGHLQVGGRADTFAGSLRHTRMSLPLLFLFPGGE